MSGGGASASAESRWGVKFGKWAAHAARRARRLEWVYGVFLRMLLLAKPVLWVIPARWLEPPARWMEERAKGAIFDCRMCGQCILSSTGMSCPMTCPKTMRSGPCGGVREGGFCEIIPDMRCVWLRAWKGAEGMKHGARIKRRQPPVDNRLAGRSTWLAVMRGAHDTGRDNGDAMTTPSDDFRPAPEPLSRLARRLRSGRFCVTAEFNPNDTTSADEILAAAEPYRSLCDAINVTDGAGGNTHISSVSVCALLQRAGHEMVMQISCRDRNRIAIQADALGASMLGVQNILCLTGDGTNPSSAGGAKAVFDLDAASLLDMLRTMRDDKIFVTGGTITGNPGYFLGASSNPTMLPPDVEVERLTKKIAAGAQFIQSQYCYDLDAFETFFDRFRARGLHQKAFFLAGVGPLRSAKTALWMRNNIAGVRIPDSVIERMDRAADPRAEGVTICMEQIERLKRIEGVAGVHIMAFRQTAAVRDIVEGSGLLDRRMD